MDTIHELLFAQTLDDVRAALSDEATTTPNQYWYYWEGLLEGDYAIAA